ncbi:MAG: hypothetical protein M3469_01535, partial [Actinomycetota bacterium]|nr:hypothetical protein [Actinomycetota bacterium]
LLMGHAKAEITVPGRAADAEALWYDQHRWGSWVDGFGHIVALEYEIKERTALTPVVDRLFVRRAMNDSLRRTLTRFANERKAEIQFG